LPPGAAPDPGELPASRHSPGDSPTGPVGPDGPAPVPSTEPSSGPVPHESIDLEATRREQLLQQLRSYGWGWAIAPSAGTLDRLTSEQLDRLLKLVEQQRQIDKQLSEMTKQEKANPGTTDPKRQEELQRQRDDLRRQRDDLQRQIEELLRQGNRPL